MKLPHKHTLSVLLCDIGLTLEGKKHVFYEQGLKIMGRGGSVEKRGAVLACPDLPLADKDGAC